MTMTENPRVADLIHYDPDEDARPQDSPHLKPFMPKRSPTISPDPSESDDGLAENDNRSRKNLRGPLQLASPGDAVLIGLLGGGKAQEVARHAARELLQSDNEMSSPASSAGVDVVVEREVRLSNAPGLDLAALAAGALKAHQAATTTTTSDEAAIEGAIERADNSPATNGHASDHAPPEKPSATENDSMDESPNISLKIATTNGGTELAPIQELSPKSDDRSIMTLPSISSQLGISNMAELKSIAEAATATTEHDTNGSHAHRQSFSSASPPRPPLFPVLQTIGGQAQISPPPVSPNEAYHRASLQSPPQPSASSTSYYANYATRPSVSSDGPLYPSSHITPGEYSSSTTETPGTDQATPGIPQGMDRMSIDNMTNPQIGGFQCNFPGCSAQPFQTQYLLNSHANVHSSNRPHYCPVKGCPRSEGGKGFKRKNEMIRHGLVHESPGYVCPYCIDREHRYPRPDNLQR